MKSRQTHVYVGSMVLPWMRCC